MTPYPGDKFSLMPTPDAGGGRFGVARGELGTLVTSFVSFMLLLACYYILRPLRDGLAATLGADSIMYLSSAVFFAMLLIVAVFGWLVARVPRPRQVPRRPAMCGIRARRLGVDRRGVDRGADRGSGPGRT
jgi:hypothetical protein